MAQPAAPAQEAVVLCDLEALGRNKYRVTGRSAPRFEDRVASPVDGSVWVATNKALLRFRGTTREEYREGNL